MKKLALLLILGLGACDGITEPSAPTGSAGDPAFNLVVNGTPYPEVDQQLLRLYNFNNCLTGLYPYGPAGNCTMADAMYDAATRLNFPVASIFEQGMPVTKSQAQAALAEYLATVEEEYSRGRMSCRARYATRRFAQTLLEIVNAIVPPAPADLSAMPQPLEAPLEDLDPFAGADCPVETIHTPVRGAGGYSLFSINAGCTQGGNTLTLSGDEPYIVQSSHSNGSFRVDGDDGWFGGTTSYRCHPTRVKGSSSFEDGPHKVGGPLAPPLEHTPADFPCTFSKIGNFDLDRDGPHWVGGRASSGVLQPGVYCATGHITLSRAGTRGNVTFRAAGNITLKGAGMTLRAFRHDVLLYSTSPSGLAIMVKGAEQSFAGHIYAPLGRTDIDGDDFTLNGTIVSETMSIRSDRIAVIGNP